MLIEIDTMIIDTSKIPFFDKKSPRYLNPTSRHAEDKSWWKYLYQFAEISHSHENLDFLAKSFGLKELYKDTPTGAEKRLNSIITDFQLKSSDTTRLNVSGELLDKLNDAKEINGKIEVVLEMRKLISDSIYNSIVNLYLGSDKFKNDATEIINDFDISNYWDLVTRPRSNDIFDGAGEAVLSKASEIKPDLGSEVISAPDQDPASAKRSSKAYEDASEEHKDWDSKKHERRLDESVEK